MLPIARLYESGNQAVEITLASLTMHPSDSIAEFVLPVSLLIRGSGLHGKALPLGIMIGTTKTEFMTTA